MRTIPAALALATLLGGAGQAMTAFGTLEEAQRLSEALVEIVEAEGLDAAVRALYSPEHPFVTSRMGVQIFVGSHVIADSREPETVAVDFAQIRDPAGVPVWPRILSAADTGDDAVIMWYHYDTQDPYEFRCQSRRASRDSALVMVCR